MDVFKAFLYGFECIFFCGIVTILFSIAVRYSSIENSIYREVNKKNNISTTYADCENVERSYLSGASVLMEIPSYDGSIVVKINSTKLNTLRTDTGEAFFTYVKKYGTGMITNQVAVNSKYTKYCYLDELGNLESVQYVLVN